MHCAGGREISRPYVSLFRLILPRSMGKGSLAPECRARQVQPIFSVMHDACLRASGHREWQCPQLSTRRHAHGERQDDLLRARGTFPASGAAKKNAPQKGRKRATANGGPEALAAAENAAPARNGWEAEAQSGKQSEAPPPESRNTAATGSITAKRGRDCSVFRWKACFWNL